MNLQRSPKHQSFPQLEKDTALPVLLVELEEVEEQLEALQQARTALLDKISQVNQQVTRAERLFKTSCAACV